jgi:hypothetical protein
MDWGGDAKCQEDLVLHASIICGAVVVKEEVTVLGILTGDVGEISCTVP